LDPLYQIAKWIVENLATWLPKGMQENMEHH
jgi:hypothetical protein